MEQDGFYSSGYRLTSQPIGIKMGIEQWVVRYGKKTRYPCASATAAKDNLIESGVTVSYQHEVRLYAACFGDFTEVINRVEDTEALATAIHVSIGPGGKYPAFVLGVGFQKYRTGCNRHSNNPGGDQSCSTWREQRSVTLFDALIEESGQRSNENHEGHRFCRISSAHLRP